MALQAHVVEAHRPLADGTASNLQLADTPAQMKRASSRQAETTELSTLMTPPSELLPVAIDTLGGDQGLDAQIEGAILAFREFGSRSILVGPEEEIRGRLTLLGATSYPIEVANATEVISMDEAPTKAVRRKPNSSLCVAYNLVQSGRASSVISAGNSGAVMAAGRLLCGLLPGIERPAIATLIPVAGDRKPNIILDSGANVECHAHNLVQFAIMGSIYCTSLFAVAEPRVALLSNGAEPSKGTDIIRAAALELTQTKVVNYTGYVEGREVASSSADVIVCDGFVGNVLLKGMEGCVRLLFEHLQFEAQRHLVWRVGLGLAKGALKRVFLEKFDYTAYGGAPLLGLKKLAVVLHGSSDSRAVKNAVRAAESFSRAKMTERIAAELTQLEESVVEDELFSGLAPEQGIQRLKEESPLELVKPGKKK